MALFPRDDVLPSEDAARRRSITQESGTRKLLIGFVAVMALWFVAGKIWDMVLLRHVWPPVAAEPHGLTVVATLDRRGSYDNNLFRVVVSEGAARAELTNYGWDSIFTAQYSPLATDKVGNAIQSAISVDSKTGFDMLRPFLAAEVRRELGDRTPYAQLTDTMPIASDLAITDEEKLHKRSTPQQRPLRQLIDYFEGIGRPSGEGTSATEGASGAQQHVEHGLAIPPDILIQTCPVVLATRHFRSGSVEEHPETVLGGKTFSLWLDLTPEGRSRFYQWSRDHVNEHLLLILNNEVVANGRIAMTMDVDKWEITNLKDGVAARKLVDYINAHRSAGK